MTRVFMQVSYDGTDYFGFQKQLTLPTIQATLEEALAAIHTHPVTVYGASRTDAGVHAYAQFIHFDTELTLPADAWTRALNANLPLTIRIVASRFVHAKFHARYNAHGKTYHYRCSKAPIDPLRIRYVLFTYPSIDITAMKAAANVFIGRHNFHNFTANHTPEKDYFRTVTKVDIIEEDEDFTFIVEGQGFLHHMVRMMVGTLLEVGKGKISRDDIQARLASPLPDTTPWNAPGHALYLMHAVYNDTEEFDNGDD